MTYEDLRLAERLEQFKKFATNAQALIPPNFIYAANAGSFQVQSGVGNVSVPDGNANLLAPGSVLRIDAGSPLVYLVSIRKRKMPDSLMI
jgi:hypothetical protein